MATKPSNKPGKSNGSMDWGNPVRTPVDVGGNGSNKNEPDIPIVIVICFGIMALTFVFAIPLLGMAYGDMKAVTDAAIEQYKIMKEETRKTRELRAKILLGE